MKHPWFNMFNAGWLWWLWWNVYKNSFFSCNYFCHLCHSDWLASLCHVNRSVSYLIFSWQYWEPWTFIWLWWVQGITKSGDPSTRMQILQHQQHSLRAKALAVYISCLDNIPRYTKVNFWQKLKSCIRKLFKHCAYQNNNTNDCIHNNL